MEKTMRTAGLICAVVIGIAGCAAAGSAQATLAENFQSPPGSSRMWVYWNWLEDTVDKEGITADLEALHAQGVGGVHIFSVQSKPVEGKTVDYMSPEWLALFQHTLKEAERLGMGVGGCLSSGWNAGGPWITPERACKKRVDAELTLEGPQSFHGPAPLPDYDPRFYRDIAIQAIPVISQRPRPRLSSSNAGVWNQSHLWVADGKTDTSWISGNKNQPGAGPTAKNPAWIQVDLGETRKVGKVFLTPQAGYGPREVELQISTDDKNFATVKKTVLDDKTPSKIEFSESPARLLRLVITSSWAPQNSCVQIAEISVGDPKWLAAESEYFRFLTPKAAGDWRFISGHEREGCELPRRPFTKDWIGSPAVPRAEVLDLGDKLQSDGCLKWEVPPGRWRILRMGYTLAAKDEFHALVKCATHAAVGLEADPLDREAMEVQFAHVGKPYLDTAGPLAGSVFRMLSIDSWEIGSPNWSQTFAADFERLRGYDPKPYLPVLAGYLIDDPQASDRFLYDYRKTLGECIASHYFGRLKELCTARGIYQQSEAGGPCGHIVAPLDTLKNQGHCEIPQGEFWVYPPTGRRPTGIRNGKQTSSAAHIYGRKVVAAEAFTSLVFWEDWPAKLKPIGDYAFTEGFNQFVAHCSPASIAADGYPGRVFWAGTILNRKVTWWNQARGFFDYMARCSHMLRQGFFVADVLYYNGDGAPNFVSPKKVQSDLGAGYDYDVCNSDVILNRMSVKDGRVVLPDGMSYRALVLPERMDMPLEVLTRLKELVAAGMILVGPRPEKDPGLKDYPRRDGQVKALAVELWGGCDGKTVKTHSFGKGRVVWGLSVRQVLVEAGVGPDVTIAAETPGAVLDWIHRCDGDTDIYFIANHREQAEKASFTFRVAGKQPELWDAVTGERRDAAAFLQANGTVTVPLELPAVGSVFVVFAKPIQEEARGPVESNTAEFMPLRTLTGPWQVSFDPKWGGPEAVEFAELVDWVQRPEEGIRYYSGKASYRKTIELTEEEARQPLHLELGRFKYVAQVRMNGTNLGVVWTEPHRVAISAAAKVGANTLEIDIVNIWPNRLIGDEKLPLGKRITSTNIEIKGRYKGLYSSGLFGPVRIVKAK